MGPMVRSCKFFRNICGQGSTAHTSQFPYFPLKVQIQGDSEVFIVDQTPCQILCISLISQSNDKNVIYMIG